VALGRGREAVRADVPTETHSSKGAGWTGEPALEARIDTGKRVVEITGTARANDCKHFTTNRRPFIDYMCVAHTQIPQMRSFRRAIGAEKEENTCAGRPPVVFVDDYDPKTNNSRLHRDHLEHKAAALAKELSVSQILAKRLADVVEAHEAAASGQEAQEDVTGALRRLAKELETRSAGRGALPRR
jgi:hypothetical protein